MRGGQRPGAGRKPRPDNKMIRVSISLTPGEYNWLKNRPDGMGVTLRYFILSAMSEEGITGETLPLERIFSRPWEILERANATNTAIITRLLG